MAKSIDWLGNTYTDVQYLVFPKTGGGEARYDDVTMTTAVESDVTAGKTFLLADGTIATGTGSGGGGGGLVLVADFAKMTYKFSDTNYATWTPSTTAATMLATQTVGTFTATDIDKNDYFIRTRCAINVKYKSGTSTAKGMFAMTVFENWYAYTRRPSTYAMLNAGTRNSNLFESVSNTWVSKYYNTSWTIIYSSSYGIYPANQAPASSSATATSPTVTVKTPVITAKCQATYFSTGMAANVDQDASTVVFKSYAYRADGGYRRNDIYESMIDMWANGL